MVCLNIASKIRLYMQCLSMINYSPIVEKATKTFAFSFLKFIN